MMDGIKIKGSPALTGEPMLYVDVSFKVPTQDLTESLWFSIFPGFEGH